MDVDITIKNYRCFEDSSPAKITVGRSFIGFVGPNNAGKSSLLRFFYEFRELLRQLSAPSSAVWGALTGQVQAFNLAAGLLDPNEVFCKFNNRDLEVAFEIPNLESAIDSNDPLTPHRLVATIPRGTNTYHLRVFLASGSAQLTGGGSGQTVFSAGDTRVDLAKYFEALKTLADTLYIPAFRNIINLGSNENYYDIRVGQAFVHSWRSLKTGNSRRDNEAAAEVTGLIRRTFGYESLEINASEDNNTIQLLIDGRSYGLHELGSGFSQFVLVLINAAVRRPSYVLIDEPELGLHATLQLQFLTTLGSFANEGVLFATHSMGLARAAGELVYSVTRQGSGASKVRALGSEPRLPELLGELSFSGYRELGYSGILLVEGVTDIKLVHELLRKFGKDHHFVVLPLGGDQLIRDGVEAELEEIKRISDKIVALIDSEKTAAEASLQSNREDFIKLCKRVGIRCHVLDRRAIENYFSDQAVKFVFGDKYRALGPYETLKETDMGWPKPDNWRIARAMTVEQLNGTDLGDFLQSI